MGEWKEVTAEQEAYMDKVFDETIAFGSSPRNKDVEKSVEPLLIKIAPAKNKPLEIIWCESKSEAYVMCDILENDVELFLAGKVDMAKYGENIPKKTFNGISDLHTYVYDRMTIQFYEESTGKSFALSDEELADIEYIKTAEEILKYIYEWGFVESDEKLYCLIVPKPDVLKMLDGELHCEDGPAVAWGEYEKYYFIRGHEMNRKVIEHPEQLTVDDVREERNAEIRRVILERYGVLRYLKDTNAELVDQDKVPYVGYRGLYRLDNGEMLFVVPDGSTKRIYPLWVPTDKKIPQTCEEAHASIGGVKQAGMICEG